MSLQPQQPADESDQRRAGGDHQHRNGHAPAAAFEVHHGAPRRNEVAVIANLAPRTIGWLQIPLTPARMAKLDALMVLKGIDPVQHILDFLDDEIFSTAFGAGASTRADISSTPPSELADETSIGGHQ